jgi:hypothetical protein
MLAGFLGGSRVAHRGVVIFTARLAAIVASGFLLAIAAAFLSAKESTGGLVILTAAH